MAEERFQLFYRYGFLRTVVFAVGFSSVFAQSLFLRELIISFYGNELAAGVILSSWLLWTGVGSFFFSRKRSVRIDNFLNYQIIFSLLIIAEIVLIRCLRAILHLSPGEVITPSAMFVSSFFALAPFAFVNGILFSFAVDIFYIYAKDNSAGVVYSLDALGDMSGGLAFSFLFVFFLSPFQNVLFLVVLNLTLVFFGIREASAKRKLFTAVLLICVAILAVNSRRVGKYLRRLQWKGFNLVASKSSLYGNLDLTGYAGSFSLYENGVLGFSFPSVMESEDTVHFSCLESAEVGRVLIVGEAVKGLLYEVLKYPVKEVVYLELDPALISFVKKYIPPRDRQALYDKHVKIVNMEARLFLNTYKGKKFDVVILNTPPPYTAYLNRFYTFEFFRKVKSVLNEGGVLSFTLPSKESYLPPALRDFTASVYYTVKKVFPYIVLVPGDKLRFIVSSVSTFLTYDSQALAQRMRKYGIKTEFVNKYYFQSRLLPWHILDIKRVLGETKYVRLNYDFSPVTYYYGMDFFSSHFRSRFKNILDAISHIKPVFYFLIFTGAGILALFLRERAGVVFSVFWLGFAGMASVVVSILAYQIVYGYVYHKIGLISASFMFGAAVGARFAAGRRIYGEDRYIFRVLCLGAALYMLGLPFIFKVFSLLGAGLDEVFLFLPALMGVITGVSFPLAVRLYAEERFSTAQRAGVIYAWDLCGGALAGVVLSMVFIPLYGIFLSSGIISYALFVSWFVIVLRRKGG